MFFENLEDTFWESLKKKKNTCNCVPRFESIKLINSKRQQPNLKNLLTKAEFNNEKVGIRKCQNIYIKNSDVLQ